MMGRARDQVLIFNLLLAVFFGITLAQQNVDRFENDFYYSADRQKPFTNLSINVFTEGSGLTDGGTALCLTKNEAGNSKDAAKRYAGRCLNMRPVEALDPVTKIAESFNTMFRFWIQSVDVIIKPGHGFAFIMAPDNTSVGNASSYLGWLNSTTNGKEGNNFAVEFDIVTNKEFRDLDSDHVGVNLNSLTSLPNCTQPSGYYNVDGSLTTLPLGSKDERFLYAWIEYNGSTQELNVTVSPFPSKPTRALITCQVDLSKVLLPQMYVGFTAATGEDETGLHNSQHSVYEWSFHMGNGTAFNIFHSEKTTLSTVAIVGIAAGIFVAVAVLITLVYFYQKSRQVNGNSELELLDSSVHGPQKFSYKEISNATRTFSDKQLLGRGGFGCVYKGMLPSGTALAVKKISKTSKQGPQEFIAEVKVIGRATHRNLVPLLGWCHERGDLLLVYEYMPNGSLDHHLNFNRDKDVKVLAWDKRLNILIGVGQALAFLHGEWEQRVVHRDVKASNVMLDKGFNARLGDFGLARLYDHSQPPNWTNSPLAGTLGYIAPELFFASGKLTEKTDVYSFGALALEVATGLQANSSPEGAKSLVDWVWGYYRDGRLLDAADSRLEGVFDTEQIEIALKVGLLCSHPDADSRPTMRQTVAMLKMERTIPLLPFYKPLPGAFSMERRSESALFSDKSNRLTDFEGMSLGSQRTMSTTRTTSLETQLTDTQTSSA